MGAGVGKPGVKSQPGSSLEGQVRIGYVTFQDLHFLLYKNGVDTNTHHAFFTQNLVGEVELKERWEVGW